MKWQTIIKFIETKKERNISNVGSVVEFSPATREARVRFPDVAILSLSHWIFIASKPYPNHWLRFFVIFEFLIFSCILTFENWILERVPSKVPITISRLSQEHCWVSMSQVLGDEVLEEYALEESSKCSISIFVNISSNADSYFYSIYWTTRFDRIFVACYTAPW